MSSGNSDHELELLKDDDPELYELFMETRKEIEKPLQLTPDPIPEKKEPVTIEKSPMRKPKAWVSITRLKSPEITKTKEFKFHKVEKRIKTTVVRPVKTILKSKPKKSIETRLNEVKSRFLEISKKFEDNRTAD